MLRSGYLIEEIVVGLEKNTWHHVLAICLLGKPVDLYLNKSCRENEGGEIWKMTKDLHWNPIGSAWECDHGVFSIKEWNSDHFRD